MNINYVLIRCVLIGMNSIHMLFSCSCMHKSSSTKVARMVNCSHSQTFDHKSCIQGAPLLCVVLLLSHSQTFYHRSRIQGELHLHVALLLYHSQTFCHRRGSTDDPLPRVDPAHLPSKCSCTNITFKDRMSISLMFISNLLTSVRIL
jgi:hypothetical protein